MRLLVITLMTLTTSLAMAIDVGDNAPALTGTEWIKGEGPDFANQITVVEFWATWCGPCRTSIPHLTKLQKQHGDKVAIIGLSDEDRPTVEPFVAEMGASMDYAVGVANQSVHDAYMKDIPGIPHAFIVSKEGKLVWHGHPMEMDTPLAQIIDGTFDPAAAATLAKAVEKLQATFGSNDVEVIGQAALEVLKISPANGQGLHVLRIIGQQSGDNALMKTHLASVDVESASAEDLNTLAYTLLTSESLEGRMLEYAIPWAAKAHEKSPQAHIIDTHARARYLVGDLDGAIELQKKAVDMEPADEALASNLAYYEKAKSLK